MALRVLGMGMGRTGTLSLKHALEILGFGPCHHMVEVLRHPQQVELWWQALADPEGFDWEKIFHNYGSAVDWPASYFWRWLNRGYPESLVILTTRPPLEWYASIQGTIFSALLQPPPPNRQAHRALTRELIGQRTFAGRLGDASFCQAVYERHNRALTQDIQPERLLHLPLGSGWEPLCRFLGVPVPDVPYPHTNSQREFQKRLDSSPVSKG